MATKSMRAREPKVASGVKQPSQITQVTGPTYEEAQGKSSGIWNKEGKNRQK